MMMADDHRSSKIGSSCSTLCNPVLCSLELPFRQSQLLSTSSGGHGGDLHGANMQYISHLISFIQRHSAVHSIHPEDFFVDLFPLNTNHGDDMGPHRAAASNVQSTWDLCTAFTALLSDDMSSELNVLTSACGEYDDDDASTATTLLSSKLRCVSVDLYSFWEEAMSLRLRRWPRRGADDDQQTPITTGNDDHMAETLSSLMKEKKRHEVLAMRSQVTKIIRTASEQRAQEDNRRVIDTVINIGEGQGYLSSALGLLDGLQVIGLDCNLQHKEGREERIDRMIAYQENRHNFAHRTRRRGRMVAVNCRVGADMDLLATLRSHVNVVSEEEENNDNDVGGLHNAGSSSAVLDAPMVHPRLPVKVECTLCDRIMKSSVAVMLHHIKSKHVIVVASDDPQTLLLPPSAQPPVGVGDGERSCAMRSDDGGSSHRRSIKYGEYERLVSLPSVLLEAELQSFFREATKLHHQNDGDADNDALGGRLQQYPRGTQLRVPCSLIPSCRRTTQQSSSRGCETDIVTVVGYDAGSCTHMVLHHATNTKLPLRLPPGKRGSSSGGGVEVVPMEDPIFSPPVQSDLSNVAIVGLHTCGDLGSDICRLFARYDSCRVCVFAGCCWHALTSRGFPLSSLIRQSHLEFTSASRLLATLPHCRWGGGGKGGDNDTATMRKDNSPTTTESSSIADLRLMFYRVLLHTLWSKIHARCHRSSGLTRIRFSPAFLRRIAKQKEVITTFTQLAVTVYDAFEQQQLATASSRGVESTHHHAKKQLDVGIECRGCLLAVGGDACCNGGMHRGDVIALAAAMENDLCPRFFKPFVGFSLLRLWMAPLVETVLLVDRCLMLCECSSSRCPSQQQQRGSSTISSVRLVPLFNPVLSPRNYIIIAQR